MKESSDGTPYIKGLFIGPTILRSGEIFRTPEERKEWLRNNRPDAPILEIQSDAKHDETRPCPPCPLCDATMRREKRDQEAWCDQIIVKVTDIPIFYCPPCDYERILIRGEIDFLSKAIDGMDPTGNKEVEGLRQSLNAMYKMQEIIGPEGE